MYDGAVPIQVERWYTDRRTTAGIVLFMIPRIHAKHQGFTGTQRSRLNFYYKKEPLSGSLRWSREGERKGEIVENFSCCFPLLNTLTNTYMKTFGLMCDVLVLFYRNLVLLCMALLDSLTKCSVVPFLKSSKI